MRRGNAGGDVGNVVWTPEAQRSHGRWNFAFCVLLAIAWGIAMWWLSPRLCDLWRAICG